MEGHMKSLKNLKSRRYISYNHIQSNKYIGMQLRKQEFFKEVIKNIQAEFQAEQLQFLIQNVEINLNTDKKPKFYSQILHNQRQSNISITSEQEQSFPRDFGSESKKQNLNPFQTYYKNFLMKSKPSLQNEVANYNCTPVRVSMDIRKRLPKKLFHVDQKMRKNYQRIKQRIIFNSPEKTFRATNSIRNSQFAERYSKTQRVCRYKTECADSQNQNEGFCVPRMLLGDLFQRQTFQDDRLILESGNQKRLLCFKRNEDTGVSGKRRKFKLHQ